MTRTKLRKGKRRIKATRRKQLKNKVHPKKLARAIEDFRNKALRKIEHKRKKRE